MNPDTKSNLLRNLLTLLLVAAMTLCAEVSKNKEFIFPEIGALCIGLWVINKHVWRFRKWQVPIIFTLSALIGIGIVRHILLPLPIQMEMGFLSVALILMLFDASITPALSACMLPILMGISSWLYPAVVLVSTTILILGQLLMERLGIRDIPDSQLKFSVSPNRTKIFLRWVVLMLILLPILLVGTRLRSPYVMVPPLIVTMVELSNSASGFRKRPLSIWIFLVVAAAVGAFAEGMMHQLWGIPQTACALLSTGAMLLIFNKAKRYFAPAAAIVLVPMILPDQVVPWYPLYVAVGATYFVAMAELCFARKTKVFVSRTYKSIINTKRTSR